MIEIGWVLPKAFCSTKKILSHSQISAWSLLSLHWNVKCPGVRTYSDAWILYPSHLNEDKVTPNYQLSNILLELVDDPTYK